MTTFNDTIPTHHERGRWMVYCNDPMFHRLSRLYVSSDGNWLVYTPDGDAMDLQSAKDYYGVEFMPLRKRWTPSPRKVQRPTNH